MDRMKKYLFFGLVLLLCCTVLSLTSCGKNKGVTYDVTYYDGETVLKTEKVKEGGYATNWTPEVEGKSFLGWFGTPNFSHEYNFSESAITSATSIYGKFLTSEYVADTRTWAIVGNGTSRLMEESAFGNSITEEHKLVKSNKENVNEYTITLDLRVDDEFQFAINSSWNNQRGAGYFETFTSGETACFAAKSSFLSTDTRKCNVKVLVDGNYTFTLTTHPNLDYYDIENEYYTEENKESFNFNDFDKITWVRNGDPVEEVEDVIYEVYVKGLLITGWEHRMTEEYTMTYNEEANTYTYTHEFFAGDKFMFYTFKRNEDGSFAGLGSFQIKMGQLDVENSTEYLTGSVEKDDNFGVTKNGTYTFTYDRSTKKCTVTYDPTFTLTYEVNTTWYIVGGGASPLLSVSNWGRKDLDERFQLTEVEDEEYTYSITLDLCRNDEFQIVKDSNWGLAHGFEYVKNATLDDTVYFTDSGNICVQVTGNYTITLKCSAEGILGDEITWVRNGDCVDIQVKDLDIYMKSSEVEDWEPVLVGTVLSNQALTFKVSLAEGEKICFVYTDTGEKITMMYPGNLIRQTAMGKTGSGNKNFTTNADYNFVNKVECNYVVTIDFSTGSPVVDFEIDVKEFEVIIKGSMNKWQASEKIAAVDGAVVMAYTFAVGDEFGFAWFDEETTTSYGNWIGTSCMGTTGSANESFNADNNFKCTVAGCYVITIVVKGDVATVDFAPMPKYQVIIKGSMSGWANSDKMDCTNGVITFEYTFKLNDEFGFAWYDETTTTSYGNWIGMACLGTTGPDNGNFQGDNNFKCKVKGTYRITIDISTGTPVVNFEKI